MDLYEYVSDHVKDLCHKHGSYWIQVYKEHFLVTVRECESLQKIYGGDLTVLKVAGISHDIGSILYSRASHHITGSRYMVDLLKNKMKDNDIELVYQCIRNHMGSSDLLENKMKDDDIDLVYRCIYNHRGSMCLNRNTIEEKILADADTIANAQDIPGLFQRAFVIDNLSREEAKSSIYNKINNKYSQLYFDYSKKIVERLFNSLKILFGKNENS